MINKNIVALILSFIIITPIASAKLIIDGKEYSPTESGVGVVISDNKVVNSNEAEENKKNIFSSICNSPFMKRYIAFCK